MRVQETERWIGDRQLRQDNVMPMGQISAYYDGKTGWISMPQGVQTLAGAQLKQVEGDLFRLYFRLLLSDRIEGRTLTGVDPNTVEIREGSDIVRVAFDPQTGLPRKMSYDSVPMAGAPRPVEEDFSDFHDVSGVKVPFHVDILEGGTKFAALTVEDYKINTGLKPEDISKRP